MKTSEVVAHILDLLRGELSSGFSAIQTFAKTQLETIAELGAVIARERVSGILRKNTQMFNRFIERLKGHIAVFARDVALLTVLTIEKAWNLVVSEIWGVLNSAISSVGLPLELPSPPQAA
jgi:hypothetical protein